MSQVADNTPIIVGVGQITEAIPTDLNTASSNADLAAQACQLALSDAADASLTAHIDVIAATRIFPDSSPLYQAPFGKSNNLPRSVASRIDANPARAVYASVGGDTPQKLVNEFAEILSKQEATMVLLTGSEVLANTKAAQKQKITLDWNEKIGGQLEDRGMSPGNLATVHEMIHQMALPMQYYGLMENARRAFKKQDLDTYRADMAASFSKLSKIAADNPHATDRTGYSPNDIATPSTQNPLIISPYTKRLIAKERVNQAAAILMTTVGKARALGIDESKWIYLHGYADVQDTFLLERPSIRKSLALEKALLGALSNAGKSSDDIAHFDLYSCFPIVVSESRFILNIDKKDPRPLSQTGGLPYFGGPGNNYSMHGIVSLTQTLRSDPSSFGLILANGGWISKTSVGIYSTTPVDNWESQDSADLQAQVNSEPTRAAELKPNGKATLISYTAHYFNGFPVKTIIIGELKKSKKRFYATLPVEDIETAQLVSKGDCVGKTIYVEHDPKGNRFAFSQEQLEKFSPPIIDTFQENYKY